MHPVLPAVEELILPFLTDHPALMPLHGGRVDLNLGEQLPAVRVIRTGGSPPNFYEDHAVVSIECWAELDHDPEASLLARTVVAALPDLLDRTNGAVRGYEVLLGPVPQPDPDRSAVRYALDVLLVIYA